MGAKESHVQKSLKRQCGSVYGQTDTPTYCPTSTTMTWATPTSQVLSNCETFKHPQANLSQGGFICDSANRKLAGDVYSNELNHHKTRLRYESCGDETGTEESRTKTPSSRSGRELEVRSRGRGVNATSLDESETSSSISLGDGSPQDILKRLKNKRKPFQAIPKTTKSREFASHSPGGQSCTSQMSSSSSPPSCCTPMPFVDFVKSKRAGGENRAAQQEQSANQECVTSLGGEMTDTFNINICNKQLSELPNRIPSVKVDEAEVRLNVSRNIHPPPQDCDDTIDRWVTPKPSPKLGFTEMDTGDIVFTAYLRMKGTGPDEYDDVKKTSERRLRGLQTQEHCRIKLYDKPTERRTLLVHKLRIHGPSYREVVRCKNSLPRCITERLITAHANVDEILVKSKRRK